VRKIEPVEGQDHGDDEERDWIARCQAGDKAAFRPLVGRYARMVHGVIGRLAPQADVDDLAQQTFLAAFEHLDQYRKASRFSTWLCQIAVNKVRDEHRAARRRPELRGDDDYDGRYEEGPEDQALGREQGQRLAAALAQLGAGDRELLVVKYVMEESFETVAEILGTSVGAAKVRALRARERLRRILNSGGTHGRRD
jgi:RNA polymerase sigma-70 factor (ECF subfamily)